MLGFYEPDCDCTAANQGSDGMTDVAQGVAKWQATLARLPAAFGTKLGSPSMCKQKDETWLSSFTFDHGVNDWSFTNIHINKPNVAAAQDDIKYYYEKYGKKIWISEFACVNDQPSWSPCTDQTQIDKFINETVPAFEKDDRVIAYGPSNGMGLNTAWPMFDSSTKDLTHTGQIYLAALAAL